MKKMTRALIAVITILALTLTSSAAFATERPAAPVQAKKHLAKASGYFNAKTLNYDSTRKPGAKSVEYNGDGEHYRNYSVSGVNTSGKLYVDATAASGNRDNLSIVMGTKSGGSINYHEKQSGSVEPGKSKYGIGGFDVKPGKKYWIGILSDSSAAAKVTAYVVPYKTRLLEAGKMMRASGVKGLNNTDAAVQFKIRPKKSGYITVKLKEYGQKKSVGYVRLLSKKKKAVSDKLKFVEGSKTGYVMFGVKKGVAYYLKVTGCKGTAKNARAYVVKYSINKSPVRNNTKKRKAVKLKRKGAWKKSVLLANGKTGKQWYKFRVTKKRKTVVKINATGVKSGTVRLTIYCGKKKIGSTVVANDQGYKYTITHGTTRGKANKGTYYIKISKSKKATGQYRVKYSR